MKKGLADNGTDPNNTAGRVGKMAVKTEKENIQSKKNVISLWQN